MQDNKAKSMIQFDWGIKSIAIQTNPKVKVTTRFLKDKC